MTLELEIADEAALDLAQIWSYISRDSEQAADQLLARFKETFNLLLSVPEAGRLRPELLHGLRIFPVDRYNIFYATTPSKVKIYRILHSARDLSAIFQ